MAEPERHDDSGRELISVARVRHTQGRRGEVAAEILTDFPERFTAGAKFLLIKWQDRAAREYQVEDAWFHKGQVILKFAGVDSISAAEQLVGHEVMIPSSERKQLPSGMYYLGDLIGCRVVEDAREIGRVADWEDTGGGLLLHVQPVGKTTPDDVILIPFAGEICTAIDVAGKVIQVRLPAGLLGLNSDAQGGRPPVSAGGGKREE